MGAVNEYILAGVASASSSAQPQAQQHHHHQSQLLQTGKSKSKLLNEYEYEYDEGRATEKRRQRVLELLAKWHPERFEKVFVGRVPEARGERERVRYGARLVVRHLKELLGRFDG